MSHVVDPRTSESEAAEPVIQVNDRRRFTEEGEPRQTTPQEAVLEEEVTRLTRELEQAHTRIDELARGYQAAERDREAFKQRVQREREQLLDLERGKVAVTLLEAIDELDLCLAVADASPLAKGVRLIRESLLKKAESTGIERVELLGQPFNPSFAEAADMELTPHEAEDGRVVAVLRACYQLKGRVIRAGQVKVARYVKPAEA